MTDSKEPYCITSAELRDELRQRLADVSNERDKWELAANHYYDSWKEECDSLQLRLNASETERKKYFDATMRACRISAGYMGLLREASEWIKQNSFGGCDAVDLWERIDSTLSQSAPAADEQGVGS